MDPQQLTLQGGLRYDKAWSWSPAQQVGPAAFLPNPLIFPVTPLVDSFNDISPRVSAVYDLFGNGKTAVKGTFGRYLEAAFTGAVCLRESDDADPSNVSRTWTDVDRDFVADCDLLNPDAQDLRASGGDVCGAYANRNFGKNVFSNTVDPAIQHGWGVRPSDWNYGISVQHEVLPRVSIDVGYVRRWFHGFNVTDNLAMTQRRHGVPSSRRRTRGCPVVVDTSHGTLRRQPEGLRPDQQLHHLLGQVRHQYQRFNGIDFNANARLSQRAQRPGRPQLREHDVRQL